MTALTLVRLVPDMTALVSWAAGRDLMPRGVDPGYALHAATKAALGDLAPKPFVLREREGRAELMGYVAAEPDAVLDVAAAPAIHDPGAATALGLSRVEARAMPSHWRQGGRWSFETRVRPIVRSRPSGRAGRSEEIDVVFWRRRQDPSDARTPEAIYIDWLRAAVPASSGAVVRSARVHAYSSVKVLRRPTSGAGERETKSVPGPDVTLRGELVVTDGDAFGRLIAHGIGRHRAFGFGCLLLAPPGAL